MVKEIDNTYVHEISKIRRWKRNPKGLGRPKSGCESCFFGDGSLVKCVDFPGFLFDIMIYLNNVY